MARENSILENYKAYKEMKANRQAAFDNAVLKEAENKKSFMKNYYSIIEKRELKDRNHGRLLNEAKDYYFAQALKGIYIGALEAATLTDDAIYLAENMVDSYIKENGGYKSIIGNVKVDTYALAKIRRVVEDAAEAEVNNIEDTEKEIDSEDEIELQKDPEDEKDSVEVSGEVELKKADVEDIVSALNKAGLEVVVAKDNDDAEAAPEEPTATEEEPSLDTPEDNTSVEEPEVPEEAPTTDDSTTTDVAPEEPAEEPVAEEEPKADMDMSDTAPTTDAAPETAPEEPAGAEENVEEAPSTDAAPAAESEEEKVEEEEFKSEEETEVKEEESSEEKVEDETEKAEEDLDDEDNELEKDLEDADEIEEDEEEDEDTFDPDSIAVQDDGESSEEEEDIDIENDPDAKLDSDEEGDEDLDDLEDSELEDDEEGIDIDGDGDADVGNIEEPEDTVNVDPNKTMMEELENEKEIRAAVELIRTRVADAEEAFIKRNQEDKKKVDELLSKISNNVATVEKISAEDPESEEKKANLEETVRMYKRQINEAKNNRPLGIFEKMTKSIAESIIKDPKKSDMFINEQTHTHDFGLIVETAKVMYAFLETLNTLQLESVDSNYIKKIITTIN